MAKQQQQQAANTSTTTPKNGHSDLPTSDVANSDLMSHDWTEDGKLTERHYRVPMKDNHGHTERITLRVHPGYLPIMNRIVQAEQYPFKTTSDLIRFAIDRVARDLERRAGIPSAFHQLDAMWDFLQREEANIRFLRDFETMARQIQELSAHPAEAAKMLAGAKQYIDNMPEGFWRERYRQELLSRFGHLLRVQAGEGASLIDGDET
jgi:hypothetical protein